MSKFLNGVLLMLVYIIMGMNIIVALFNIYIIYFLEYGIVNIIIMIALITSFIGLNKIRKYLKVEL